MIFKILFTHFLEAYEKSFLGDSKARKATRDMINLASAYFKLYMADLISDNEMLMIRSYYHHIGTCAKRYGLEDLWVGKML